MSPLPSVFDGETIHPSRTAAVSLNALRVADSKRFT